MMYPLVTGLRQVSMILLTLGTAGLPLAGCANAPHRTPAQAEAAASCRKEVDRVYAAQNRDELSRRNEIDTPFAAGYLSGIPTRGLSAQYGADGLEQDCLNASSLPGRAAPAADPGVGPAFTPARR